MVYVNIKLPREGLTYEQKKSLIAGISQLLSQVLGRRGQKTMVVIDEIDTDNFGQDGQTISDLRLKGE